VVGILRGRGSAEVEAEEEVVVAVGVRCGGWIRGMMRMWMRSVILDNYLLAVNRDGGKTGTRTVS